jgi:peptidyl-prolyl cis-trans isomerase SurA
MKQRTFISVLAVSASLLTSQFSLAQQVSAPAKPQAINSIAVVVNDEVITQQEVNERIVSVERRLKAQGTALPDRAELKKQLIERLIVDRAQLQLAKENGMRVDDVMLDRTLQRMAEQNKMNLQEFRNQIEREGTSFARFREEIRDDIMMQRIREREVDSKILITESEIDNFWQQKPVPKSVNKKSTYCIFWFVFLKMLLPSKSLCAVIVLKKSCRNYVLAVILPSWP